MAEYKMGFIGTGNMGSALARAAAKSGEPMGLDELCTYKYVVRGSGQIR